MVAEERAELSKKMKDGTYIDWLKKEHGIMDEKEIMLDKQFLDDIIREIERNREKEIVYSEEYKNFELNEWRRRQNRKELMRRVAEKGKLKEKLKKIGGPRIDSYDN